MIDANVADANLVDGTTVEGHRFDPARARGRGTIDLLRSFRTAAALGWKMEANWTDPVLFFIYSVAKPVASALILVAMTIVFIGLARWLLQAMEERARREGRLTVRWR
jgi:hypothetical protein